MSIQFNSQQLEAIEASPKGAYGVISSAGSGKTTVLINRIVNLVKEHKVFEQNILSISFTRNTSNDLKSELEKKGLHHVNVGTFHSICARILAQEGKNISNRFVQEWQVDNLFKTIDQNADTKEILGFISYQKSYLRGIEDEFVEKNKSYTDEELRYYYKMYENMKKSKNLYDFDDYLLLCLEILKKNPNKYTYEYVLVDEHQDSNNIQNELLKYWCKSGNLFSLSDYRQAVYGFNGSNPEFSMNFDKYWENSKIINMYTNYRSPRNIVNKSNEFIKQYYGDYEHYMDAESHKKEDGYIEINSHANKEDEAKAVADEVQKLIDKKTDLNEIAVIYRLNKHADYVESELKLRDIEYDVDNNGSFFKRKEIAGILSFLRLIQDSDDDNAFENVFRLRVHPLKYFSNVVFNGIKDFANQHHLSLFEAIQEYNYSKSWHKSNARKFVSNIRKLTSYAEENDDDVIGIISRVVKSFGIKQMIEEKYTHKPDREERLNSIEVLKSFVKNNDLDKFIMFAYNSDGGKKKEKDVAVRLMTIHKSKGLEFDNVFVVGIEDKEFPNEREGEVTDMMEEARLMYVACTRSKQNLWLNEIGKNNQFIVEYGEV